MDAIIQVMESALGARDPYTVGHQQRVTMIACAIARELGLSQERIHHLRVAGTLHDLGKIAVPGEILAKPGKLTDLEFAIVKRHPQVACDIVKPLNFLAHTPQIILQHHERLNGSGYPQGLRGDDILLEARILGVADVVEAMYSHRPYRPALGLEAALEEISRNRSILYDPAVVDACLKLYRGRTAEANPFVPPDPARAASYTLQETPAPAAAPATAPATAGPVLQSFRRLLGSQPRFFLHVFIVAILGGVMLIGTRGI